MTHILYISAYYPPEKGVAAVCVSAFATRLAKRGNQVTVLTTVPNHPTGIVPPEYRGRVLQEEMCDGVRVVRTWSYTSPNTGFLRRVLAQLSFGCLAPLLGGKAVGRPDIILVESPPLFDAIAGRILAWWKRCPLIFSVSDPWPEAAVQLGMLRNPLLIRLSEWLEWSTYQRASLVWVVSKKVRDMLIRRGLSPDRIFLLTNGVDITKFHPLPRSQSRHELGWDDRFTILYAGNHGLVYSMTTMLDVAEHLQHYSDIHIILAGDGPKKAQLIAEAQRRSLKNLTFLDPQPHDRMPLLLASADVCLIPLRRMPLNETTLPVKMFEIMACARPFILGGEGLVRQIAEQEAGAAIHVEQENPTALASAILNLREHPDLAEALGQRGRAYVEARFDYDQLAAELDVRIAALLGKKTAASPSITPVVNAVADEASLPRYVQPPTEFTISPLYLCWRTMTDLTFALCGLLVMLLILPVLALLIYLDSPGPIFYGQERVGYEGRKFYMHKFRSMHTDAGRLVWATKDDTRVTRVGRFLRATHLDELPQVMNILRGEMSLIGPRPEQEEYVAKLEKANPLYRCRFAVKPGLTGWAQVMYGYGDTSQEELIKLQYDLYYIEHQSFRLDIRILLKTIVEVVLCHGT